MAFIDRRLSGRRRRLGEAKHLQPAAEWSSHQASRLRRSAPAVLAAYRAHPAELRPQPERQPRAAGTRAHLSRVFAPGSSCLYPAARLRSVCGEEAPGPGWALRAVAWEGRAAEQGRFCAWWLRALGLFTCADTRGTWHPAPWASGDRRAWRWEMLVKESAPVRRGRSPGLQPRERRGAGPAKLSVRRGGPGSAEMRQPTGTVKGWSGRGRCGSACVT